MTALVSDLRAVAADRLAELKIQLRASLGSLSCAGLQKSHLDTLAELRASLLREDKS